jgi:hypothetical protein
MAKFKDKEGLSVTLFPMFNILISTLGVLIFIMSTITLLSMGDDKTMKIVNQPKQNSDGKMPFHFIWDGSSLISMNIADTVVVKFNKKDYSNTNDIASQIKSAVTNSKTGALLDKIKKNSKQEFMVIFVRESGFESFAGLKKYIKSEGISIGYEPMNNSTKIKL